MWIKTPTWLIQWWPEQPRCIIRAQQQICCAEIKRSSTPTPITKGSWGAPRWRERKPYLASQCDWTKVECCQTPPRIAFLIWLKCGPNIQVRGRCPFQITMNQLNFRMPASKAPQKQFQPECTHCARESVHTPSTVNPSHLIRAVVGVMFPLRVTPGTERGLFSKWRPS